MFPRGQPGTSRPSRIRSRIVGLGLALLTAISVAGVLGTAPARADTTPVVSGTSWMGGQGVNACGMNGSYDSSCGGDAAVGTPWQCVELAQRLYTRRGWYNGIFPGVSSAYQIFDQASAMGMTAQANGSITSIVPGDMIIHTSADGGGAGHVTVVDRISGSTVYAAEQNFNNTADIGTYTLSGGTLSRGSMHVRGVVHSPNNPNTNGATGKSLLQVENTGSGWSAYNLTASANKFIQGAPSVVWNGQLIGFGVTSDGKLDQFSVCPGGGAWCSYDLTGANAMSGGVRAVINGSSYEVFGPSADGSLLQVENTGSGWNVYNLSAANGVKTAGAPGVSWWASGGPTIYAVDTAGNLRNFHVVSGAWQAGIVPTSEHLSGGVWASSDGTQLFARGVDGHMLQIALSGGVWSTYDVYPGLITSGSPGVIWTSNGPNIYVADAWGALRELYISGGAWHVSAVLPDGAVSSGVDAVQVGSNLELFAASA